MVIHYIDPFNSTLTWPIVREDFSKFILREIFKSYIVCLSFHSNERYIIKTIHISCNYFHLPKLGTHVCFNSERFFIIFRISENRA
jgi:hypothetical protein